MPEKKQEIFAKYGKSNTDTGSPESQVALFSYRIAHLTEHVKKNKKDVVTRRSLLRLVGKRRQVLDYLQKVDIERYKKSSRSLVSADKHTVDGIQGGRCFYPLFCQKMNLGFRSLKRLASEAGGTAIDITEQVLP